MDSIAAKPAEVRRWLSDPAAYERILTALARNARMGPFVATSGLSLPYLLAAMTSLLDADAAPAISRALAEAMLRGLLPRLGWPLSARASPANAPVPPFLCIGMETAGGVLAAQLAAVVSSAVPELLPLVSFGYLRKKRKGSGTQQQLEGPAALALEASRAASASAGAGAGAGAGTGTGKARVIFVDDVMSTGGSLVEGARLLREQYGLDVAGALFIIDRSKDRAGARSAAAATTAQELQGIELMALFDVATVEERVRSVRGEELQALQGKL